MKALSRGGDLQITLLYNLLKKNLPLLVIEKFSLNYFFFSFIYRGRKLNSHLERAIQKAMAELDKQSDEATKAPISTLSITTAVKSGKGNHEKKSMNTSPKSTKSRMIKIAPAPIENTKK